jgi:hypothetical protein
MTIPGCRAFATPAGTIWQFMTIDTTARKDSSTARAVCRQLRARISFYPHREHKFDTKPIEAYQLVVGDKAYEVRVPEEMVMTGGVLKA